MASEAVTSASEAVTSEAVTSASEAVTSASEAVTSEAVASTTIVKFEYACIHDYNRIFYQPLFCIAMNMKNQLLKKHGSPYNEKMILTDLQILSNDVRLEISPSCLNDSDFNLNYIMDRYVSDIQINYKGALMLLKTDKTDVKQYSLKMGQNEHTVTSVYEISYTSTDFILFEEFIKTSVFYFKRFADDCKIDKKRLKMYISSEDGGYFENIGSRPKRSLKSVFLPKEKKNAIVDLISKFIDPKTIQRYEEYGINHKLTILFEGIPGTGKSSLIAALASHFNLNIALISFTPKMTDVGFMRCMRSWECKKSNSEENGDERNTLLVIEDMDCIFKERKSNDEHRNMVTFSGILNALDGLTTCENQIVILTTNHIENLDPALIRPGRVDHIMRFDYATKEQIKEIFSVYTQVQAGTQAQEFYEAVQRLNINITTSLLQQYLLKYANQTELILENIDELKTIYDSCNKQFDAKMYI
jgi:hypothetical protein